MADFAKAVGATATLFLAIQPVLEFFNPTQVDSDACAQTIEALSIGISACREGCRGD